MGRLRIGAVLECLHLPLRQTLQTASSLALQGVQVDAVGELAPDTLSATGRKDLRHLLRSLDLELAALGCPLRYGFNVLENLEARLAHVRKVMSLAFDLGPRRVVVYAGPLPTDEKHPTWPILTESLTALDRHGEKVGTVLVLATGAEEPTAVAAFLRRFPGGGLGASLDPAALVMRGRDPCQAVRDLSSLVVYTYARDARPERPDRGAEEVPLGHGDVDWAAYLGALEEIGYQGWLTIRRGPCADPVGDIKAGAAFLRRLGA